MMTPEHTVSVFTIRVSVTGKLPDSVPAPAPNKDMVRGTVPISSPPIVKAEKMKRFSVDSVYKELPEIQSWEVLV